MKGLSAWSQSTEDELEDKDLEVNMVPEITPGW